MIKCRKHFSMLLILYIIQELVDVENQMHRNIAEHARKIPSFTQLLDTRICCVPYITVVNPSLEFMIHRK